MELQASGMPRESAVSEHPTDLAFEVRYEALVAHVQDGARQCLVPIQHQATVRRIITGYLAQVVRKWVRILAQRLVDSVTSRHRMPGEVNYSGRRKAQMDGTAVEVVERKLVDEVRAVSGSGSSADEGVLPHRAEIHFRGCRNQIAPRQACDAREGCNRGRECIGKGRQFAGGRNFRLRPRAA